ncbi:hypothetical protein TNIN_381881 [Trichonephila inaurata madagascariensis]|uniref:Uncharacterized protein n=1 Tax=Trichonephila inaurata madagascariensis TaxID=2747483 RepID=A0A8X6YE16_9ARAC|nr:hypothetical protein TNIN_381881 [Trichonephila inaurata madagascariensis]
MTNVLINRSYTDARPRCINACKYSLPVLRDGKAILRITILTPGNGILVREYGNMERIEPHRHNVLLSFCIEAFGWKSLQRPITRSLTYVLEHPRVHARE